MIFSVAASGLGLLAFLGRTDEDRGVIALTEPQTWTTIGVLAATLLGTITLVSTMLMRTITAQIGGLRGEISGLQGQIGGVDGQIGGLHGEIGGLRGEMVSGFSSIRSELRSEIGGLRAEMTARFEAVDARFDTVNTKIEGLDRDVQLLMNREFGKDR